MGHRQAGMCRGVAGVERDGRTKRFHRSWNIRSGRREQVGTATSDQVGDLRPGGKHANWPGQRERFGGGMAPDDDRGEAVPEARHGLDVVGVVSRTVQRLAQRRHVDREDPFLDGNVAPDEIQQLTLRHDRAGAPHQRDEQLVRLRRERHESPGMPQPALADVEHARPERIHLIGHG